MKLRAALKPAVRSLLILLMVSAGLMGCVDRESEAVWTVEQYLNALAEQNVNQISNLSCQDWESDALMEVYSFNLVKVTLEDVDCAAVGEDDDDLLISCSGAMATTYNNETSRIELDQRTYTVREEKGDLFVCGYR